jgi:hypothetical protein
VARPFQWWLEGQQHRCGCQFYVIVWQRYTFALFLLETWPVDEPIVISRGHSISAGTPRLPGIFCYLASEDPPRYVNAQVLEVRSRSRELGDFSNTWRGIDSGKHNNPSIIAHFAPFLYPGSDPVPFTMPELGSPLCSGVCCSSPLITAQTRFSLIIPGQEYPVRLFPLGKRASGT